MAFFSYSKFRYVENLKLIILSVYRFQKLIDICRPEFKSNKWEEMNWKQRVLLYQNSLQRGNCIWTNLILVEVYFLQIVE